MPAATRRADGAVDDGSAVERRRRACASGPSNRVPAPGGEHHGDHVGRPAPAVRHRPDHPSCRSRRRRDERHDEKVYGRVEHCGSMTIRSCVRRPYPGAVSGSASAREPPSTPHGIASMLSPSLRHILHVSPRAPVAGAAGAVAAVLLGRRTGRRRQSPATTTRRAVIDQAFGPWRPTTASSPPATPPRLRRVSSPIATVRPMPWPRRWASTRPSSRDAWASADTAHQTALHGGAHPARHAVPLRTRPSRRGLRLLRAHHVRLGAGRRRRCPARAAPRSATPRRATSAPARPATSSSTPAT